MRGVGGVRESIHQSWLAKGLGLGLLCWGLKRVQEEIPSEEASTLQIWSVVFPPGQCTSPQLHSCHRLFDQDGDRLDLVPFNFCFSPMLRSCRYETAEEMKEAVTKVIDTLTQEDFHGAFQKLLEQYNICICSQRRLLRRGLDFYVCTINKSTHTKKKKKKKWSSYVRLGSFSLFVFVFVFITFKQKNCLCKLCSPQIGISLQQKLFNVTRQKNSWSIFKANARAHTHTHIQMHILI